MSGIRSSLRSLTLFGRDIQWQNFGNKRSVSKAGQLMTVGFVAFSIFIIFINLRKLLVKENPRVTVTSFSNQDPDAQPINSENYPFAFGMMDNSYRYFIDEQIYKIEAFITQTNTTVYKEGKSQRYIRSYSLKIESCTNNLKARSLVKTVDLSKLYCLSDYQPEVPFPVEIKGTFESPVYQNINIIASKCNNITAQGTCASKEQIKYKLNKSSFNIFFLDFAFDPQNFEEPVTKIRKTTFFLCDADIFKEGYLETAHRSVISDVGVISNNNQVQNYIGFGQSFETFGLSYLDHNFFVLFLQVSPDGTRINRSYTKLATVLAELSGSLTTYLLILTIILSPVEKFYYYKTLISSVNRKVNYKLGKLQKFRRRNQVRQDQKNSNGSQKTNVDYNFYNQILQKLKSRQEHQQKVTDIEFDAKMVEKGKQKDQANSKQKQSEIKEDKIEKMTTETNLIEDLQYEVKDESIIARNIIKPSQRTLQSANNIPISSAPEIPISNSDQNDQRESIIQFHEEIEVKIEDQQVNQLSVEQQNGNTKLNSQTSTLGTTSSIKEINDKNQKKNTWIKFQVGDVEKVDEVQEEEDSKDDDEVDVSIDQYKFSLPNTTNGNEISQRLQSFQVWETLIFLGIVNNLFFNLNNRK